MILSILLLAQTMTTTGQIGQTNGTAIVQSQIKGPVVSGFSPKHYRLALEAPGDVWCASVDVKVHPIIWMRQKVAVAFPDKSASITYSSISVDGMLFAISDPDRSSTDLPRYTFLPCASGLTGIHFDSLPFSFPKATSLTRSEVDVIVN
jgi:hypothetical protein